MILWYIRYVLFDMRNNILFKFKYIFDKFLKRFFNIKIFNKDFVIYNSDGNFLCKHWTWDDYTISTADEKDMRSVFIDSMKGWWIFMDIWAHIWKWSIVLWRKYDNIKCYAFEPNPDTFEYLKKNVEINNLNKNVFPVNIWIWDKEWELDFFCSEIREVSSFNKDNVWINKYEKTKVWISTLDKFITDNEIDIEQVSLMKIDVEWFEREVVDGMKQILKNGNMKIIMEILNDSKNKERLFDTLERYWFKKKMINESNFLFYK